MIEYKILNIQKPNRNKKTYFAKKEILEWLEFLHDVMCKEFSALGSHSNFMNDHMFDMWIVSMQQWNFLTHANFLNGEKDKKELTILKWWLTTTHHKTP